MEEEITDIINELKLRYTPENFKKMKIKKGKILGFDYEGSKTFIQVTRKTKDGKWFGKQVELHSPTVVSSHYNHAVDSSQETPYCQDCQLPVTEQATAEGNSRYEARKERYLSDGTPIDEAWTEEKLWPARDHE